jgi:hypothetical protein
MERHDGTDPQAPAAVEGTAVNESATSPRDPPQDLRGPTPDGGSSAEAPPSLESLPSIIGRKRFNDLANENRSIGQLKRSGIDGTDGTEPGAASVAAAAAAADFAALTSKPTDGDDRTRRRWLVACATFTGVVVLGVGALMLPRTPSSPVGTTEGDQSDVPDLSPTTVTRPSTSVAPTTTCPVPASPASEHLELASYRLPAKPGKGGGNGGGNGGGGGGGGPSTTVAPSPTPAPRPAPTTPPPSRPAPTVAAPPTTARAVPPPTTAPVTVPPAVTAPAAPTTPVPPPPGCP